MFNNIYFQHISKFVHNIFPNPQLKMTFLLKVLLFSHGIIYLPRRKKR